MGKEHEKAAKAIGVVVLVLTIAGGVALASIIIAFFLMMRSCSADNKPDNTGKKLYTADYIERYLERRYDRDFTFISEGENKLSDHDTEYIYTYSDSDGVNFEVKQTFQHGYLFNGHYAVTDYYMPEVLLTDNDFMDEIERSGYDFESGSYEDGSSQHFSFYVTNEKQAEEAAGFIYDLAEKYGMAPASKCESYNEEWHNFRSETLMLYVEVKTGVGNGSRILADASPTSLSELTPYDEEEKKQLMSDAVSAYQEFERDQKIAR